MAKKDRTGPPQESVSTPSDKKKTIKMILSISTFVCAQSFLLQAKTALLSRLALLI